MFSIDCWTFNAENGEPEESYANAIKLLSRFGKRSIIMKEYSVDAAKYLTDLDFVYIDAAHQYKHVSADIRTWFPLLSKGGCLAGHDYSHEWRGVIDAVDEFVKENKLTLHLTGIGDTHGETDFNQPSWFFFKP